MTKKKKTATAFMDDEHTQLIEDYIKVSNGEMHKDDFMDVYTMYQVSQAMNWLRALGSEMNNFLQGLMR